MAAEPDRVRDMKMLFLHHGRSDPSTRFRVHPWMPLLEAHGIRCDERPMRAWRYWSERPGGLHPRGYLPILETISDVTGGVRYDIVFTQRFLFPHRMAALDGLLRLSRRLIVDVQDALFCSPDDDRPRYAKRLHRLCSMADCVLASNAFVAEWIGMPEKTLVMPSVVDCRSIPERQYGVRRDKIIIGWIGQANQLDVIRPLFSVFRELVRDSKVEVVFHTSTIRENGELRDVGIKLMPFSEKDEVDRLQEIDIGLMPMPKTIYNLGKCPLKVILYMASGAAAVCSPVGSNLEMIEDGVQGFFAETPAEWYERLTTLIRKPDMRATMGRAGRKRAEERYSVNANWPRFRDAVVRVTEGI